jgi:hypothetical protein
MIQLDQTFFKEHFTIPNLNIIDCVEPGSIPFNFVSRNKSTLVVTLGDSWSWGKDIEQDRLEFVFGNRLSLLQDADFLNLSVSGAGNQYITQLFCDFADIADSLCYKKVLIIVTFTEMGRDFDGWFDRDIDYRSWLLQNILGPNDYTDFLAWQMRTMANTMKNHAEKISNLELIVGTNFVDAIGLEPLSEYLLSRSWIEVYTQKSMDHQCHIVSPYIISDKYSGVLDLCWELDRSVFLSWAEGQLDNAIKRAKVLKNPKLFYQDHPLIAGHVAWANYIKQSLM